MIPNWRLNALFMHLVQVHLVGPSPRLLPRAPLKLFGATSHRERDCMRTYGVHGRSKFTSVIGFGGSLDVGQQCERELWDSDDDSICGHSGRIRLHQLHVVAYFLAKVKWVIGHLKQLLQHVIRGRSVGPVDCYLHHFIVRK